MNARLPEKEFLLGRRVEIVLKSLALVIAVALVAGIVYGQLGRKQDRKRLAQIGRSVDTAAPFCKPSFLLRVTLPLPAALARDRIAKPQFSQERFADRT